MPTGGEYVGKILSAFQIPGVHYDQCASRCWPDRWPHCMDCSGLAVWGLNQLGISYPCNNSWAQAAECHRAGTGMSFQQALVTPGAWWFQGANEGQTNVNNHGHIGISAGDGVHSLEARGHWSGVGVFYARSLRWDYCAMPPALTKGGAPPPKPKPPVEDDQPMGMIAMPATSATPKGRNATARAVKGYNFVLLEDGARLTGDVAIDAHRHWWAPPHNVAVPGWQIIDVADLRPTEKALVVRFGYPNGDAGTYKAMIP